MEKALGMLLGLQIGDCLGSSMVGSGPKIPEEFQSDINEGTRSEITSLALHVLDSLVECEKLDIYNLGKHFVSFFDSGEGSLGNTENSAFYSMKIGLDPRECGVFSGGNGSLLRCAPLALFYSENTLKEASYLQTSLTHSNEVCKVCDYLFLSALTLALEGKDKEYILTKITEMAHSLHLLIYDALKKVPFLSWEELETSSYVVDTFTSAFWALKNCESFEEAVLKIARKGDDSRACTALTGALCGAYFGADAIPERWCKKLQQSEAIEALLNQISANNP